MTDFENNDVIVHYPVSRQIVAGDQLADLALLIQQTPHMGLIHQVIQCGPQGLTKTSGRLRIFDSDKFAKTF
jgi:hypothetical protein